MTDVLMLDIADSVATVTLNRPEQRNALSVALLRELGAAMEEIERRADVLVAVLTGADPAFCAGLDLKELGKDGGALKSIPGEQSSSERSRGRRSVLRTSKLVIGAINGVCVTGGLELALNCDFLVASRRARFADTHARVGVHPLWGLTVLLPQAVGLRRAREMTATGNFVDADTALQWGLVNHVVEHEDLLACAKSLARDATTSDQIALRAILDTYLAASEVTTAEAWKVESRHATAFMGGSVDPAEIERRRKSVVRRGRSQV